MKFEVNYSVARHLCQKALSYRVEFCLVKLRLTEYFYIGLVQFGPAEKKTTRPMLTVIGLILKQFCFPDKE